MLKQMNSTIILLCFLLALSATLGSLFFSEVMHFVPCSMCWYQRIFMYPLVVIFMIALLYPDDKIFKYSMPIVSIGLFFAIYHNLLMFKIIPEKIVPCVQGVPCSTRYLDMGLITIPFLSLIAFSLIFILLLIGRKGTKNEK